MPTAEPASSWLPSMSTPAMPPRPPSQDSLVSWFVAPLQLEIPATPRVPSTASEARWGDRSAMAMGRAAALVMAMAMVAFMWAGYGDRDAKLASGSSLLVEGESVARFYHEEAAGEFGLDEPTRRKLGTATAISYAALGANMAPCPSGAAGSSYYSNCAATGTVTPYTRACLAITRCQRG